MKLSRVRVSHLPRNTEEAITPGALNASRFPSRTALCNGVDTMAARMSRSSGA